MCKQKCGFFFSFFFFRTTSSRHRKASRVEFSELSSSEEGARGSSVSQYLPTIFPVSETSLRETWWGLSSAGVLREDRASSYFLLSLGENRGFQALVGTG